MDIRDQQQILSAFGLNAQAFPMYYPMGATQFQDSNGNASGAQGSVARLSRALSNFPHMITGLRIQNVYPFPVTIDAVTLAQYENYKRFVDGEQTISISLAQQNIIVDEILQTTITGLDGIHWHSLPTPFPMAGANNIELSIKRLTSYVDIDDVPILPTVHVTLVTQVLRADMRTTPPNRAPGGAGR